MKTYKFELLVNEQNDEFFEEITENGQSGSDEVFNYVNDILGNSSLSYNLKLIEFKDK